jgi:hypothetical protein
LDAADKSHNTIAMKKLIIFLAIAIASSSCIIEVDMTPPNVIVDEINEYQTREVFREVWSGNKLIYEEYIYHNYLEIYFCNIGGITARNVWAEVSFYDDNFLIERHTIDLPKIYAGETLIYEFSTSFQSTSHYPDYEVVVYWD